MNFSRNDLLNLASAVSSAATSSYIDERLVVAATQHHLAARIWVELGYPHKAMHHSMLAEAIDAEMISLAAGEEVA